ncbi:hypothetical protein ACFLZX_03735 [Nanoarchaeota archaeon]
MKLADRALMELLPERAEEFSIRLKYSGKFSSFNGNIRYRNNLFEIGMSKNWKGISPEIQMGLIQILILKVLKIKKKSHYIDLYHSFMKKIHIGIPKDKIDPELEISFDRVNEVYFNGLIEKSNLVWCDSINKLGSYDYGRDKISISRILRGNIELLDYVMYHEMLHKKHKFNSGITRSTYHTKNFRMDEKEFENSEELENKLKWLVRKSKMKRLFF